MNHEDPLRLRALKALSAALQEINPSNGYRFDLRDAVFRGRDTFGNSDPLPMVSILESITERDVVQSPRGGATQMVPWELLLQGWMADDDDHPTDPAHHLLAAVKKRLVEERVKKQDGSGILGMCGKIDEIKFSTGVVRPADEVSSKAYFWLKVELVLVENLLDPYS